MKIKSTGGVGGNSWELIWHGEKLLSDIEREAMNRVDAACNVVRNKMIKIQKPGSGRVYKKVRGGKAGGSRGRRTAKNYIYHRASAPGQPPAPDTGHLRRSIQYEIYKRRHHVFGIVGTSVPYGKWLEFGTRRMKPRPFARPALDMERARVLRLIGTGYK